MAETSTKTSSTVEIVKNITPRRRWSVGEKFA